MVILTAIDGDNQGYKVGEDSRYTTTLAHSSVANKNHDPHCGGQFRRGTSIFRCSTKVFVLEIDHVSIDEPRCICKQENVHCDEKP